MSAAKRILIVDDEDKILFVVRHALARLGARCHVETTSSSRQALEMARKTPFDLLITDLRMPEMDGIALTEALRSLGRDLTVIWMTAYNCCTAQPEAERLGVYCCLNKPIEIGEIRRIVSKALWNGGRRTGPQKEREP